MLNSKIFLILLVVVAVLAILYFMGKKSVQSEINIAAPPEKVWTVLTATENYENWNSVMNLLEGEIKEGNKVKYRFTQDADNVSEIPSTVKKVVAQKLLNQGGGVPLILTFNHKYILESSAEGTKLTIHEEYEGIGVNFWNPAPVQKAYERLAKDIKRQSERP